MIYLKIRFIIEKQNGFIKNHKALDNIRNTIVGHIQIDYRITCALYNFQHNPCNPDGINGKEVAKRMKKKFKNLKTNPLIFLLSKHLNTKFLEKIKLSEINDFKMLSYPKIY